LLSTYGFCVGIIGTVAHIPAWRLWLVTGPLLGLAVPSAAARAEDGADAVPGVVCVTRALRIGAAEVNGITRRCEDSPTGAVTTTVTFSSVAADGTPVSYTPLPDDLGSGATLPADLGSDATLTSDPSPEEEMSSWE
jgi:hypothetical protein